jgi:uncharacterized membrane protein
MTQALAPLGSFGPLLVALILISLGIGLPILIVLGIRFLWYRDVAVGRSRELDKLVWQLHRIASALENQQGSPMAAYQPVQQYNTAPAVAQAPAVASPAPVQAAPAPVAQPMPAPAPAAQTVNAPAGAAPPSTPPPPVPQAPGAPGLEIGHPQKAGVNSMFGF